MLLLWLFSLIASVVLLSPLAWLLTSRLSKKRSPLFGILPALALTLAAYIAAILSYVTVGLLEGLITFACLSLASFVIFCRFAYLRHRRYETLADALRQKKRSLRPEILTTVKMSRQLKGFAAKVPIPVDAQHEIVILLKNGTDPKTITSFYNCRESDLVTIERAFDAHTAADRVEREKGIDYTVTPDQREFLLRLMLTATPSSLSCGDGLLWQEKSVGALIKKASGQMPSRDSILRFLSEAGMLLEDDAYLFSETPEGVLWEKTQFEKIRMAALEHSAEIFWVFSLHAADLPYTVLVATGSGYPTLFGVYKENSGLGDFLNKLGQLSDTVYAVTTFRLSDFKKFTAPPANVTLFPYGERSDIPDRT